MPINFRDTCVARPARTKSGVTAGEHGTAGTPARERRQESMGVTARRDRQERNLLKHAPNAEAYAGVTAGRDQRTL